MNQDTMAGKWKQMKGKVKEKWGKLTDDDLDVINGRKDQLIGRVQERYGIMKDEAEKQVDEFWRTLGSTGEETSRQAHQASKPPQRDEESKRQERERMRKVG